MGAVYEAEDLELGGHVALKTVRPETATNPRTIERFKQEIYLARKVTHANVCRIFDLFHHRLGSTDGEIMFVTMELLRGETLAERLRRVGRMSTRDFVPLVTQMAQGLHAAHQVGIVHRDFKPSNVVLVPVKEQSDDVRAVVSDFGLAHTSSSDGSQMLALTGTGDVVGTPAYIAPEILDHRGATAATDIYALGVVMYEMVTGRLPFEGDTPLIAVLERLRRPAESPRALVPELDPRWEAIILRCLEREPADRFASAADVVSAFGEPTTAHVPSLRRRRTNRVVMTVAAVAVLTAGIGALATWASRAPANSVAADPAATPLRVRRSVAVLGFKNLSQRPDAAWLSAAFSDMLTTELAAGEKLRTVAGEQVVRMKLDLQLADADSFAKDTLARIRRNLGTDLVVLGSYLAVGEKGSERIRLDLRVQDAAAGETIASVSDTGTHDELLSLVSRIGVVLRERLGVGELSGTDTARVKASVPSSPEVVRLYTEGLARLRLAEYLAARDLLLQVIAAQPEFPLGHVALAAAWSALGFDSESERSREARVRALRAAVSSKNVSGSKGDTANRPANGSEPSRFTGRSSSSFPTTSTTVFVSRRCRPRPAARKTHWPRLKRSASCRQCCRTIPESNWPKHARPVRSLTPIDNSPPPIGRRRKHSRAARRCCWRRRASRSRTRLAVLASWTSAWHRSRRHGRSTPRRAIAPASPTH